MHTFGLLLLSFGSEASCEHDNNKQKQLSSLAVVAFLRF